MLITHEGARADLGEPMEWQVLQYPRLSAQTVKFANSLSHKALSDLELTSAGQPYLLHPDATMPSSEFPVTVRCSINGHNVRFGLDAGLCVFLLSDWLPLEDIVALPDNLKKSIIIAVLNPVADFFLQHSIGSFNVEDIECQSAHPSYSSLFFNLSSINGTIVGRMFADIDGQTIDTLYKIWQAAAGPAPLGNIEELPIRVEVVAAATTLSLSEFGELKEDDIILLDIAFSELREVYARISDGICFLSVIDGNKLIIQKPGGVVMASAEQPPLDQEIEDQAIEDQKVALDIDQMPFSSEDRPDEESLDEPIVGAEHYDSELLDADSKQTNPQKNDLGDLPIELLFIVDQFRTTVKEVERIKPGYVFELKHKAIGQVEIHANGTLIGTGELVQIEDRAGVRVTKLYGQTKDDQ